MEARALICDEDQNFTIEDVYLPEPAADQIAVRTLYSGVSIGTEFALIRNKISWGPYPLCVGYQGTGVVEGVGDGISDFRLGDLVYFRGCDAMRLADGTQVSCVSGAHSSHVVLRPNTTHGAAKLPPGAPPDLASMFVMPAVGLYGVDMANPRMGHTVVVHGAGLIGQGVIAACAHRGCTVIAIDLSPVALGAAAKMGADHVIDASAADVAGEVHKLAPEGADVVFECTGIPACIDVAIPLCRAEGVFVWQGNYGEAPVTFSFLPAHGRRLRMFFPCDDGLQPCRRAVVKNLAMGTLRWEHTITHRIGWEEAPAMYERISRGAKDVLGVIVHWSD